MKGATKRQGENFTNLKPLGGACHGNKRPNPIAKKKISKKKERGKKFEKKRKRTNQKMQYGNRVMQGHQAE